jgi:hypothetical protein
MIPMRSGAAADEDGDDDMMTTDDDDDHYDDGGDDDDDSCDGSVSDVSPWPINVQTESAQSYSRAACLGYAGISAHASCT